MVIGVELEQEKLYPQFFVGDILILKTQSSFVIIQL